MIQSKLLSNLKFINHGFFGRQGGVSTGIYESLNTSFKVGDSETNVRKNREIIASKFNLPADKLLSLNQIHSTNIVYVDNNMTFDKTSIINSDGILSNDEGVILSVYTADCLPILLTEVNSKTIIALHCGWKGLLGGIIQNALTLLKHSSDNPLIYLAIGPCIHQQSYEVDNDFYHNFIEKDQNAKDFFILNKDTRKYHFNLPYYAQQIALSNGIKKSNTDIIKYDTLENEDLFFSHRRSTKKSQGRGLQLSCIKIVKE